jgi:hypothetical protein
MNKLLLNTYRVVVPKPLRTIIVRKALHRKILRYFGSLPESEVNDEQREVLDFLKFNPLSIFPYPFQFQYNPDTVNVIKDKVNRMHYVLLDNKRLYFKKNWSVKRIRRGFTNLMLEQDISSPHRYLNGVIYLNKNDVVADVGAAEGNFSLSVIEKIKKLYIFEYDREWVKALKLTFAPWKDKVEIVNKRVSDSDDAKNIRLDTFLKDRENVTFLKIDVDGAEQKVLNSCKTIINGSNPVKIALCTYHRNNDEKDFTRLLSDNGFRVKPSKGYMINYFDKQIKPPYLRRGLIMAFRD